jgi:hypothetical protein
MAPSVSSTNAEILFPEPFENFTEIAFAQSFSTTPSQSHPTSNAVLIELHTTVLIPDYALYYKGSLQSFVPQYHALADGSLVATPFITDVRSANVLLAVLGVSTMFFIVNTCTAIQYLRRNRIRKMFLFYFLLASQVLGTTATLAQMSTFFDQFAHCTT